MIYDPPNASGDAARDELRAIAAHVAATSDRRMDPPKKYTLREGWDLNVRDFKRNWSELKERLAQLWAGGRLWLSRFRGAA